MRYDVRKRAELGLYTRLRRPVDGRTEVTTLLISD